MIKSFGDKDTEALFNGDDPRRLRGIARSARRKLDVLDFAGTLSDLAALPGNRLEALRGDRRGFYAIRINDQWRLCFRWKDGAEDVEIIDYH